MYCTKKGEVGVVLFLIVSLLLVCFLVNSVSAKTYSGSGDCSSVVNNDSTLVGNIPCLGIDGLDINQTNITLDCQGYSIIGNGTIGTVGIVRNNSANNITIKNCNIRDFATGINAVSSWVIYNNTISNNTAGLTLSISNSGNLTVNNNSFILNGDGIQFKQIVSDLNSNQYYFNNFFNNTVDMRGCYGGLSDGFVRIYNNTFHGSFILDTNCGSFVYGVFIYNNLFFLNYSSSTSATSVFWNSSYTNTSTNIKGGYFSGGNFFFNYTGNDTNDDGIGDQPSYFNISGTGDNVDYLPLVNVSQYLSPNFGLASFLTVNSTFNTTNPIVNNSKHSTRQNITFINLTSGRKYVMVDAFFNGTVDLSNLTIDANSSSVVINTTKVTGINSTITIYLNNSNTQNGVFVCPDAKVLSQVNTSCTNIITITAQNVTNGNYVSGIKVTLEGSEYKIENVTGTGVMLTFFAPNWTNPSNTSLNFTRYQNFTANVTFTDNMTLDKYVFSTNASGSWTNLTRNISGISYNASESANITLAKNQSICWYYLVNNTWGYLNQTDTFCFTVQNTAPLFNETFNVQNINSSTNFTFLVNVTDIDNDNITYYVNDSTFVLNNRTGLFNFSTNDSVVGRHLFNVTISDGSVNVSQTLNVTINDITPPTFSNAVNTSLNFRRYQNFTSNITITDGVGLSRYIFSTNVSGSWVNNSAVSTGSVVQYNASTNTNITPPRNSNICWYYSANDTSNNNISSSTYCFTVQNTAPTFNDTFNIQNINSSTNFTFRVNVTDIDDDNITYYVNDSTFVLNNRTGLFNFSTNDSVVGRHLFNVTIYDGSVNISQTLNVTINDTTPPTFSNAVNTSLNFRRYQNFTANITITDGVELSRYIFSTNVSGSWINGSAVLIGSVVQYNASNNTNITPPRNSNICWYYSANDTSNNNISSSTYCFTVNNSIPSLISNIPDTSVQVSSSTSINLSNYVTDLDGDNVNYTVNNNFTYSNVTISNTTKIMTITGITAGTDNITLNFTDGIGNATSNIILITVTSIPAETPVVTPTVTPESGGSAPPAPAVAPVADAEAAEVAAEEAAAEARGETTFTTSDSAGQSYVPKYARKYLKTSEAKTQEMNGSILVTLSFENKGRKNISLFPQVIQEVDDPFFVVTTKTLGHSGSWAETLSGIVYSSEPVAGRLLKANILNAGQIVLQPGQKIDKVLEIKEGLAVPRQLKIQFTTLGETVTEKEVQITPKKSITGAAVDVDSRNHLVDVYAIIVPEQLTQKLEQFYQEQALTGAAVFTLSQSDEYYFEISINKNKLKKDDLILPYKFTAAKTFNNIFKSQSSFGDFYGPYIINQNKSIIFAQQFKFDPKEFYGQNTVETKVYRGSEVIVKNEFEVNLGVKAEN